MDSDDDKDNKDTVLHIIPSKELRLIPLYIIITHIYEKIIEKAGDCKFTYDFGIEQLIKEYGMNAKLATPGNKMFIISEIKRLFPGIKITEIVEKYSIKSHRHVDEYNSYWRASWEEDNDDIADADVADGTLIETDKCENDDTDDIMLNQAIQLSLNEVKKPERAKNSISVMGKKAEERIQKSQQKYKKLYN
jgi:hypothetical protein